MRAESQLVRYYRMTAMKTLVGWFIIWNNYATNGHVHWRHCVVLFYDLHPSLCIHYAVLFLNPLTRENSTHKPDFKPLVQTECLERFRFLNKKQLILHEAPRILCFLVLQLNQRKLVDKILNHITLITIYIDWINFTRWSQKKKLSASVQWG